jgi:hypothetical protein
MLLLYLILTMAITMSVAYALCVESIEDTPPVKVGLICSVVAAGWPLLVGGFALLHSVGWVLKQLSYLIANVLHRRW